MRDQAKKRLPKGWSELVDHIYNVVEKDGAKIRFVKKSVMKIQVSTEGELSTSAYIRLQQLERESERTCMHCGRHARLREGFRVLCEDCNDLGVQLRGGRTFVPHEES